LEVAFFDRTVRQDDLALAVELIVQEVALQDGAVVEDHFRLAVQFVSFPFALLVFLIAYEAAEAVECGLFVIIKDYLAIIGKLIILEVVFGPYPSKLSHLIEIWSIFYTNDFLNPSNSEFIFEFQLTLIVQLPEVELARFNLVVEKLAAFLLAEELRVRPVKHILNDFKLVFRPFFEQIFINAPELEF